MSNIPEPIQRHRDLTRAGLLLRSELTEGPNTDSEYIWFMLADELIEKWDETHATAEQMAEEFLDRNPEYGDRSHTWHDREKQFEQDELSYWIEESEEVNDE